MLHICVMYVHVAVQMHPHMYGVQKRTASDLKEKAGDDCHLVCALKESYFRVFTKPCFGWCSWNRVVGKYRVRVHRSGSRAASACRR